MIKPDSGINAKLTVCSIHCQVDRQAQCFNPETIYSRV